MPVNTQQDTLLLTRSTKLVLRTRRRTVLNAVDLDCLYFKTTLAGSDSNKKHVSKNQLVMDRHLAIVRFLFTKIRIFLWT